MSGTGWTNNYDFTEGRDSPPEEEIFECEKHEWQSYDRCPECETSPKKQAERIASSKKERGE